MHGLCSVLLACVVSSTAYTHKYSSLYNTIPIDIKRYNDLQVLDGGELKAVLCPVCPGESEEECKKVNGVFQKVCRFGTHINFGCHERMDCYRGPGEICSDERSWQCEPSLSCRDNQCRGFSLFGQFEHPNYAGKDH